MVAGADAPNPNGRQYHQFDMDLMVWTAEVLDCRASSDSCAQRSDFVVSVSDEFNGEDK
jgi:hypothetical protein